MYQAQRYPQFIYLLIDLDNNRQNSRSGFENHIGVPSYRIDVRKNANDAILNHYVCYLTLRLQLPSRYEFLHFSILKVLTNVVP